MLSKSNTFQVFYFLSEHFITSIIEILFNFAFNNLKTQYYVHTVLNLSVRLTICPSANPHHVVMKVAFKVRLISWALKYRIPFLDLGQSQNSKGALFWIHLPCSLYVIDWFGIFRWNNYLFFEIRIYVKDDSNFYYFTSFSIDRKRSSPTIMLGWVYLCIAGKLFLRNRVVHYWWYFLESLFWNAEVVCEFAVLFPKRFSKMGNIWITACEYLWHFFFYDSILSVITTLCFK